MKGVIILALRDLVEQKFGKDKWNAALKKAGIEKATIFLPITDVDDRTALKVIGSLCEVLNISLDQAADAFGDYWVNIYARNYYPTYFRGAATAKEFLLKMDSVHVSATQHIENARPPRFDYEWKDEKTMIMHYKSKRGLIDFLVGLIKGVGAFYKEDLKVAKLGSDKVSAIFPN